MKTRTLFAMSLFTFIVSFGVSAQETITNESVLQMKDLGFDDDMIIDKINTSDVKFKSSIAALSQLKEKGVSSEIISVIMAKSQQNTKSKTGIYYKTDNEELELIQPTVFSGSSSNSVAQKLVSGFINSKQKARLPKTSSSNQIKANELEFIFVFDPSTTETDNLQNGQGNNRGTFIPNWWFRVASNPNEFVLLKLTVKENKNLREVVTGKSNVLTSSEGIDPRYAIDFKIEEIEGNKFKVTPIPLETGEYAFLYQGQVPQGRSNQSVFDFSVR